ncbi:EpsG family protein [Prevotella melaninogenica]|uniref:EpsG family protein n=1 Tax=Prevotella melaninogenica TaxID=28132 RepID=A0A7D4FYG2_9BACT|nr:EpsG family protein [Prevotella melaninogenica]QKH88945.1 EpsG family protein [Prevotella melaninogenica]
MIVYLFIFILVLFINSLAIKYNYNRDRALFFSLVILAVFVGLSDMLGGYDRYIYASLFDDIADITRVGGNYKDASIFTLYPSEIGYIGSNVLISFITSNRYIFILLYTLIIYFLYYFSLKKYCINYPFAIMLFMGLMFFFTFTYFRQMVGVGIAWFAIRYVYKKELYKFIICVLVAASFHNSAIILFPLYFLPIKRFSQRSIIIIMSICLVLGLSGGPSALFRLYGDVTDMQYRTDSYAEQETGFRYEYIIEAFVFLYFILKNYSLIPTTKKNIVLLNTSLGFCAILLLFVLSLNGGRLGWYYLIGVISTLSLIANNIKSNNLTRKIIPIICFLLFFRIVYYWGFLLSPYKTFFTNGVREYDPIYEKYEYDEKYSIDKFYR